MNKSRSPLPFLLLVLFSLFSAAVAARGEARAPERRAAHGHRPMLPRPAVRAVVELFRDYPVVVFAESHGNHEEHEFLHRLIADPAFADAADDVAIEWGNARYQPLVDRYLLALQDVPREELRKVWRDTTQYAPDSWDGPMYEQFFHRVRAVNQQREPAQRIRVLLGDPPIDWTQVRTPEEYFPFLEDRDRHFARVLTTEVLARNRKALVIVGALHAMHQEQRAGEPRPFPSVTGIIEAAHPGKVYVVTPFTGGISTQSLSECELEARFDTWKQPALAEVEGTWFGELIALDLETPDGRVVRRFHDLIDALLYLGPPDSLREAERTWAYYVAQPEYVEELARRRLIIFGEPADPEAVQFHKYGHPAEDTGSPHD